MRKLINILTILFVSALSITSCLSNEEIVTTPECAIIEFSVGDIRSPYHIKKADGGDSVVTRIISSKEVFFNIDQNKGLIYTVDSLPKWADLTRVVPSFTAHGTVLFKNAGDSLYYRMTSGKDSINFENPVELINVASDNISSKRYIVKINKKNDDTDTLNWKATKSNLSLESDFKVIVRNSTIYLFSKNANGNMAVTSASAENESLVWNTTAEINGAEIDYESIVLFNDHFYAVGKDSCIYTANDQNNPVMWQKACDKKAYRMLATDKYYMYALDENGIIATKDLVNWSKCGNSNLDMLPEKCVQSFSYKSKTNDNIQNDVMVGLNDKNTKNGISWFKISSDDEESNQDWMYIQVTRDNSYGLPKFKNMSCTYYHGNLYAIGIEPDVTPDTYKYIYVSVDNGITWKALKKKYMLPADLNAANGPAKIVTVDDKLWIIQNGGNIWSGNIK